MNYLQFIRVIMDGDQQNVTSEEIRTAFDRLMRYCEECLGTPAELQKMLYIQGILSSFSYQDKAKKIVCLFLMCVKLQHSYQPEYESRNIGCSTRKPNFSLEMKANRNPVCIGILNAEKEH